MYLVLETLKVGERIPADEAKEAFPWGRGVRVSPLERAKVLALLTLTPREP